MVGDSILIVGPGAVGGLLAAQALKSGQKVYCLARSLKTERCLAARGIVVKNPLGRTQAFKKNISSARASLFPLPVSVAFFCVKNQDLAISIRDAKKYIAQDAPVVFFQNGLEHAEMARRYFENRRVIIGACYFSTEKTSPNFIVHSGGYDLRLAKNTANAPNVYRVVKILGASGFCASASDSEGTLLWEKLCLNAAINPTGTLAKAANGRILLEPGLREIALKALHEAVLVAQSQGQKVSEKSLRLQMKKICRPGSEQKNSTLQDIENGRPTEINALLGPILKRAREKNIKTPILERMFHLIKKLERQ